MKKILSLMIMASMLFMTGCHTTDSSGKKQFDPVKTEQVKAAVGPVIAGAVRRVVLDEPKTAQYFKQTKDVLQTFRDNGQFSPDVLVTALDDVIQNEGLLERFGTKTAGILIDVKNLLIALYRVNYAHVGQADLPADKFAWNLLDTFVRGVGQGLTDAGVE